MVACHGSSSNSSSGLAAVGYLTSINVGPIISLPPGRRDNSKRCSNRHEPLRSEVKGRTEEAPYLKLFLAVMAELFRSGFSRKITVEMPMFSLLEGPQQSAPTAVALAAAAPAAEAMTDTRVFPDVSSKGVAEAPTSSAGAESTAVPAAAPATGGTVFRTTSVEGAARAPAPADETAASKAAPATGGTVFPTTSVGGAARAPAPADETAATKAVPTASGTVPSATPLRGAVGARESSAGAASSDAAAEAAPPTGDTTAPDASVERAARMLTLEESSAGAAPSNVAAEAAPPTGDTTAPDASVERAARMLTLEESSAGAAPSNVAAEAFPLEVRYYNSSWPKHGSNSNSSSSSKSSGNGSSSSSNDTTSNYGPWWDTTCVIALLRPFDPGKGRQRDARRGKAVLDVDLPFDRGNA